MRLTAILFTFLQFLAAGVGGEMLSGRVYDKLDRSVPVPEICLLPESTRCTTGDDSGRFSIEIPSRIRTVFGKEKFRAEIRDGKMAFTGSLAGGSGIEWFDAGGHRLFHAKHGISFLRVSHGSQSVVLKVISIYGRATRVLEPAPVSRLAKGSASIYPDLKVTKSGFKTRYFRPYSASTNWVTMTLLGDSGYVRTLSFESDLKLERDVMTLRLTTLRKVCGSAGWDTSVTSQTLHYALSSGKLFVFADSAGCTGSKLAGSGTDIIGTWKMEDDNARLPPGIISTDCKELAHGSPGPSTAATVYRISEAKFIAEVTGESCSGSEVFADLRNFFRRDTDVSFVANTCRGSVFSNSRRDTATVAYHPHGARDSLSVTFTLRDQSCSYVDPLLFADSPSSCPAPSAKARQEFYTCIRATGFTSASFPALKRGGGSRERPQAPAEWLFLPFDSQIIE